MKKTSPAKTHAKMRKEARSWGLWLLGIGILSLFLTPLDRSWGIVLVIAGLASFVFRETPMFVVYGAILAWAGIANLSSGQPGWMAFAVFQFFLAFLTFSKYTHYRRAEKALGSPRGPQRASRTFPQIGCALGALAFVGMAIIVLAAFIVAIEGSTQYPDLLLWLESLATGLAVLGLAVAAASLLSGFRYRVLSVLTLVACGPVLLLELIFVLVASLG